MEPYYPRKEYAASHSAIIRIHSEMVKKAHEFYQEAFLLEKFGRDLAVEDKSARGSAAWAIKTKRYASRILSLLEG